MSTGLRVFVNSQGVTVAPGHLVLDAVRAADPGLAAEIEAGSAYVTDGVGRRIAATDPVGPGTIVRVVRSASGGEPRT